jgi:Na+/alanine symporter
VGGTHVHHGDLLGAGARVIGPVGQGPVGLLHTLVLTLVEVVLHLLPLLPAGSDTQQKPSAIHTIHRSIDINVDSNLYIYKVHLLIYVILFFFTKFGSER